MSNFFISKAFDHSYKFHIPLLEYGGGEKSFDFQYINLQYVFLLSRFRSFLNCFISARLYLFRLQSSKYIFNTGVPWTVYNIYFIL